MDSLLVPFILLGETAYQAYNGQVIAGSRVVVGVRKNQITDSVLSTIKTTLKEIPLADNGFTYQVGRVPVTVKFIRNNYKFFQSPDVRHFMWDVYRVPNPFSEYWPMRGFIR